MKVVAKGIKWDVDVTKDARIRKEYKYEYDKAHEEFEECKKEEDALIEDMLAKGEIGKAEDFDRDYTTFEECIDLEKMRRETLEKYLGLPASCVVDVDLEELDEKDVVHALELRYKEKVTEMSFFDKAKGNEVAKQNLVDAVDRIIETDDFKAYLDLTANFEAYSHNNKLLVYLQKPDATMVKGASKWREMGRFLNPNVKPIWIYAPVTRVYAPNEIEDFKEWFEKNDWAMTDIEYARALKKLENDESIDVLTGYKVIPVYDVSDTHGKELPTPAKDSLSDEKTEEDAGRHVLRLAEVFDIHPLSSDARGQLREIVDSVLHTDKVVVPTITEGAVKYNDTPEKQKFETNAVCYIVSRNLGLDTQNINLYGIAKAFQTDPVGTRETVFRKLYSRIDKTAQFLVKNLDKIREEEKEAENERDEQERDV